MNRSTERKDSHAFPASHNHLRGILCERRLSNRKMDRTLLHQSVSERAFTRMFRALLTALLLQGVTRSQEPLRPIITGAELLKLTTEEAAAERPVRITGVVLGTSENGGPTAVVHDGDKAVYVRNADLPKPDWKRGDRVEVTGVSDPGGFAPIVIAKEVRHLGTAALPTAIPATYENLLWGGLNGQWIEMTGIVRSCVWRPDQNPASTELMLATGGQKLLVRLTEAELRPEEWVDASVRIRAVCFHQYTGNRQAIGANLWVPAGEAVVSEWKPPANPFEGESRSIRSVLQFSADGNYGHRGLIEGEVLYHQPGKGFYMRDWSQGIWVKANPAIHLRPGDSVKVLGFPLKIDQSPVFDDAICQRVVATAKTPEPVRVEALEEVYWRDPELVTMQVMVLNHVLHREGRAITVEKDGTVFPVIYPPDDPTMAFAELKPQTKIELTGICVDTGYWQPYSGTAFAPTFRILLRSPTDVKIVAKPPWWTPERTHILSGFLAVLSMGIVVVVVLVSRRRLRRQQAARKQAEAEFAVILNERNRMAREIHDTIAQDLSAIAAQLEVARSKLGSGNEDALRHIQMAREAACSGLQEARRSIWNMRSQVLEDRDLATALIELLEDSTRDTPTHGIGRVSGEGRRLPPAVENHLLRIGQQAIQNAMHHGKPGTLELLVDFASAKVTLVVKDDGRGFDPVAHDQDKSEHFGLAGMRERVQQCGGVLVISSSPDHGTEIRCEIPIAESEARKP